MQFVTVSDVGRCGQDVSRCDSGMYSEEAMSGSLYVWRRRRTMALTGTCYFVFYLFAVLSTYIVRKCNNSARTYKYIGIQDV